MEAPGFSEREADMTANIKNTADELDIYAEFVYFDMVYDLHFCLKHCL